MINKERIEKIRETKKETHKDHIKHLLPEGYTLLEYDNEYKHKMHHNKCDRDFIIMQQLFMKRLRANKEICTECNNYVHSSGAEIEVYDFVCDNYSGEIIGVFYKTNNFIMPEVGDRLMQIIPQQQYYVVPTSHCPVAI